ncbi:selenocysteine-specific translation elongation factor [Fusibacter sp. JL216-2]|uniref:selenocysteine-specific translation elongation factor n=1 Tax=Fusibacter sp. JL216-2 TaxID=3071453 RepID=UPI003D34A1A1
MTNIVIGTAGHIDHGKSALIRRLTGIEPDRWEEERKRGITIDLGFAFFDLPSQKRAGIVDVPGHEKFIRNMLAGVSGIDLVLLVVSAEEGVMPQTQEHLDILNMLEVKRGIVVLTKSDLVDEEMIELVQEDVKEHLVGTFLEDQPMIPVSSITGAGLDKLVEAIDEMAKDVEDKPEHIPARLPIDRVFSLQGVGTVITGTLVEGKISQNDILTVYPSDHEVRIRKIQNHNEDVEVAYAGQRVALNLTGIDKNHLHRGDVLAKEDTMKSTMMLDVDFSLLKSAPKPLSNWTRLRLYQGTKEVLCRIVLLDREELLPGDSCLAQLRLEDYTACKYDDRFVVRLYSPLITVGGGKILDPNAVKHKRFKDEVLDDLMMKLEGDPKQIVDGNLLKLSPQYPVAEDIAGQSGLASDLVMKHLNEMLEEDLAFKFESGQWVHRSYLDKVETNMIEVLKAYHDKNPLKPGMPKEELRNKILDGVKNKLADVIFDRMKDNGHLRIVGAMAALQSFEIKLNPKQQEKMEKITNYFKEHGTKPPAVSEAETKLGIGKKDRDLLEVLFATEKLVRLTEKIWMDGDAFRDSKDKLVSYLEEHGKINLAEFRDLVGTSRKNAVALLEYFDSDKLTKRQEDYRVLR